MPKIVINRCVDLCVVSVFGALTTVDDSAGLADSLLYVADDALVILDLSGSTALSGECSTSLGCILEGRQRDLELMVVVGRGEVANLLVAAEVDRLASILPSLEAALDCIRTPDSLDVLRTNLLCSAPRLDDGDG